MITKDESLSKIKTFVDRLNRVTLGRFGESDTIIGFFVPMLEQLGWDIPFGIGTELHFHGYADKSKVSEGLPDCVLNVNGKPYAVCEIKSLGFGSIGFGKDKEQLMRYFPSTRCKIGILTRVYQTQIFLPDGTRVAEFSMPNDYVTKFDELWKWLSKENATKAMIG